MKQQVLHQLWTSISWQIWLTRNDDLHDDGRDKNERERKHIEKLTSQVVVLIPGPPADTADVRTGHP
jgi:hypothetical protein